MTQLEKVHLLSTFIQIKQYLRDDLEAGKDIKAHIDELENLLIKLCEDKQ